MIKKFLLSSFILLSLHSFAQEGTASPYSYYGIGVVKFQGTVENKSMGGLGILPDSIHMNLQNPASLSALKLTTYGIGGTYNTLKLKNETTTEKARRTTLDYLAMAFPAGKLGLSLGLMPYSSVGYKIKSEKNITLPSSQIVSEISSNYGSGGVNKVFVGAGYEVTPKLSVGADLGYNFGKIETNSVYSRSDIQLATMEVNTSALNGLSFNTGAIYKSKLKKYDLVSSVTFSPGTNLKSKNTRTTSTIPYTPTVGRSVEVPVADSNIKIPTKFAFGAGLGHIKKWFVGFETTFQGVSNSGNAYASNVSFESATKIALGGYYTPNYNSFSNYLNKITYRAGFRHENTGLVINSKSINDTALTLGFGMPVGGNFSNVNVGLEYGKRGTTNVGLIQENYLNISVGLSFNDRWFVKRKYD
ncbi:hypothetical protein SAMN05660845_1661 [Flavobacterium swingsii]|uniref:Long-chain fatty acid transport protein n=1 Tax=Flavobacterium swingsii TaxID=498292 RepID=A0A1I0YF76_9FLAO|nr:hypothetical protein [Flavobacterium swingsii]SFB11028.1 hypothetical protein SAMN05660845_1661 [Flavobacterium swingsii]